MKFKALTLALFVSCTYAVRINQTTHTNTNTHTVTKDHVEDEISGALVQEESVAKE